MSEWQPIETAPKDGSAFLAFYVSKHGPKFGTMQWFEQPEKFHSWTYGTETSKATHWMPLPDPPFTQEARIDTHKDQES